MAEEQWRREFEAQDQFGGGNTRYSERAGRLAGEYLDIQKERRFLSYCAGRRAQAEQDAKLAASMIGANRH